MNHYIEYVVDEHFRQWCNGYYFVDDESFEAFVERLTKQMNWISIRAYHGIKKESHGRVVIGSRQMWVTRIYSGEKVGKHGFVEYQYIDNWDRNLPFILKAVVKAANA